MLVIRMKNKMMDFVFLIFYYNCLTDSIVVASKKLTPSTTSVVAFIAFSTVTLVVLVLETTVAFALMIAILCSFPKMSLYNSKRERPRIADWFMFRALKQMS